MSCAFESLGRAGKARLPAGTTALPGAAAKTDPVIVVEGGMALVRRILSESAAAYGVDISEVANKSRKTRRSRVVAARHTAIGRIRAETAARPAQFWSLSRIGSIFGVDHTTVSYAIKKYARGAVPSPESIVVKKPKPKCAMVHWSRRPDLVARLQRRLDEGARPAQLADEFDCSSDAIKNARARFQQRAAMLEKRGTAG